MHGIGYHGRTAAEDTGCELEDEQQHVACAAKERDAVDAVFA